MGSFFYVIFVLFSTWIASLYGSLTMNMLMNRNVVITGPQNVTVFMRSSDTIIVAWTLPQIYVPHDTSDKPFEELKNADVAVLKPLFSVDQDVVEEIKKGTDTRPPINATEKTATPSAAPTQSLNSNANETDNDSDSEAAKESIPPATSDDNKGSTSAPDANAAAASSQAPSKQPSKDNSTAMGEEDTATPTSSSVVKRAAGDPPVNLNHEICKGLTYYADYTVGEKTNLHLTDNGWAVSLLNSNLDIPVTNMSLFVTEKDHKLVKFQEGCVTQITVKYSRMDSRPEEKQIVVNASDHLVILDNLKPGVRYKIVVTTHFVSGDSISAKAIYVTTLLTGSNCRCDWHGTKNHTSDCESPSASAQHCSCHEFYTGRFCQDCADGYYRDKPGDGCKKCPCGEHGGVSSSCRFQQGFLTCDKCAKGYAGSVCHRCAKGYFRYKNECRECLCNDSPNTCNPTTGMCTDCQHNTTGFYCERCKPKYMRVPPTHSGSCYHIVDIGSSSPSGSGKKSSSSGLSPGVIGAIVFVVALCICIIVGLWVVRRVRTNRQRRALWTVEMRPDNDDLDFNSVHNEDARMDNVDDMAFYDRQTGRSKAGGKYSRLNEEC